MSGLSDMLTAPLERAPRLNFIIAGAAKSGTTALHVYLRRTPGVYVPLIKELNFFSNDRRYGDGTRFWRLHAHFIAAPKGAVRGEATPGYLYETKSFARIHAYNPGMKIVCILRNPVLRAYSGWNFWAWRRRDSLSFMDHVRTEMEGPRPGEARQRRPPTAIARSSYSSQIEAMHAVFPREQVMWIKYEDFSRNQRERVRDVVDFIGGPPKTEIVKTRRVNAFPHRRAITADEYAYALQFLTDDIDRVERFLGWDCSDWRQFQERR